MEHKYEYVSGRERPRGCIFCMAASGELKDLVLYVDDKVVIMLNKFPYNTAHLLIAPSRHVKDLRELTEDEVVALHRAISFSMRVIDETFSPQGYNLGLNQGRAAGASVEHLHFHLVPRRYGEYNFMETIVGARSVLQKPETVWRILKPKFDVLRGGRPHH